MRNIFWPVVLVAMGCGGSPSALRFQKERAEAALNHFLTGQRRAGMAAAAVKGDRRLWSKGLGLADRPTGTKATPDTPFLTASVSKTVATVAVMRLVEEGRASLDADVNTYLPVAVRNPAFPDVPITLRELLAHTSGIVDAHLASLKLYTEGRDDPTPLEDLVRAFFAEEGRYRSSDNFAAWRPGTAFEYSNLGFALVGAIVQRVSGEPFDRYTERTILRPLGMANSHWRIADFAAGRLAVPYADDGKPIGQYSFPDYPNGGLRSTANDLSAFVSMMIGRGALHGARIVSAASVAEMLRVQYPAVKGAEDQGLGWQRFPLDDSFLWGHAGGEKGAGAFIGFEPQRSRGMVFVENMTIEGHEEQYRSIVGELLGAYL